MLEELGLTAIAEQIYQEVIRSPNESRTYYADFLGLPVEGLDNGIELLSSLGLIGCTGEAIWAYNPEIAADTLLRHQKDQLMQMEMDYERSNNVLRRFFVANIAETNGAIGVERIFGASQIRDRISLLSRNASSRIDTLIPAVLREEVIEISRKPTLESLERGIQSRAVYIDSVLNDPINYAYLRWVSERGSSVRIAMHVPIQMLIFDQKTAVLPLSMANALESISIITDVGTVTALNGLFEQVWLKARPFGVSLVSDAYTLTELEKNVLSLLAEGLTDKPISRRLGVSERLARKTAKDLMVELGAKTRFELGMLATKAGWL